jgi:DNA-binding PadR family transcriptional regulator
MLQKSERLWPMATSLSEADFSVLETTCKHPSTRMLTPKNSANHVFWSEMEKLGWLQREAPPADSLLTTKAFTLTQEGRRALNRLVPAFKKARARSESLRDRAEA